eukprot:GILK01003636.1.p1 GENE.GILK01003636.1~~GILK01003636.1.p1  ORF type:complete len:331 (+),score=33.41 GILK01003636.1:40-993(+)
MAAMINPSTHPAPFNLRQWVEANKDALKPPTLSKIVYGPHTEFTVEVVGGPSAQTDYQVEEGEVWFYQLNGDMTLKIVENGVSKEVAIREGESFLLPARVPHSPQRFADTLGLVIGRGRSDSETTDTERSSAPDTPSINPDTHPSPVHLLQWLDSIRSELQPPVGNKMLYGTGAEFKVMVVGGPNIRRDYHVEDGEEWFYQLYGDMVLKVVDNGVFKDIVIKEGESFLLPANVPHSPQRFANTVGLVIERERKHIEMDHLRWYCQNCHALLFEETFYCYDLGVQLKPVIEKYYASEDLRRCKQCGVLDLHPSQTTAQ